MVQFLSIIFFLGFLQFLLGFLKVPFFCVTLYIKCPTSCIILSENRLVIIVKSLSLQESTQLIIISLNHQLQPRYSLLSLAWYRLITFRQSKQMHFLTRLTLKINVSWFFVKSALVYQTQVFAPQKTVSSASLLWKPEISKCCYY